MNMDSIKKQLTFFGSALNIRNKRNDIIASNIANAATPNYLPYNSISTKFSISQTTST